MTLIMTFFSVNVFLIFFLIYKNSHIIQLTFQKQEHEKNKIILLKEKKRLELLLHDVQKNSVVHNVASKEFEMQKIKPSQIKHLSL